MLKAYYWNCVEKLSYLYSETLHNWSARATMQIKLKMIRRIGCLRVAIGYKSYKIIGYFHVCADAKMLKVKEPGSSPPWDGRDKISTSNKIS
jgi:hypothetical protein